MPSANRKKRRLSRRQLLQGAAGIGLGIPLVAPRLSAAIRNQPTELSLAPLDELILQTLDPFNQESGVEALTEVFARSGIAVFDLDIGQPLSPVATPASPLSFSLEQVTTMVTELRDGTSRPASAYDEVLPVPTAPGGETLPQVSDLFAGYLAGGETSGAEASRLLAGTLPAASDLLPAADLPVSTASISLMTGEILGQLQQELPTVSIPGGSAVPALPGLPEIPPMSSAVDLPPLPELDGSACSNVQRFVSTVIQRVLAVVDAASQVVTIPILGQIVAGIGKVIRLGISVVVTAIETIVAPVMGVLRAVSAGLAIASTVLGTISTWNVKITATPDHTRLGVGALEYLFGDIVIDAGGADEINWPPLVADCAMAANLHLPPRTSAGSAVRVEVKESAPRKLLQLGLEERVLNEAGKLLVTYGTENETEEQAKGQEAVGIVSITATIERDDVRRLLNDLIGLLLAELPEVIATILQPIVGPVVNELRSRILDLAQVSGHTLMFVTYHREPEPTPPAEAGCLSGRFRVIDPKTFWGFDEQVTVNGDWLWEFGSAGSMKVVFVDLAFDYGEGWEVVVRSGEATGTYSLAEDGSLTIQFLESTAVDIGPRRTDEVDMSLFSAWHVRCGTPVVLQNALLESVIELEPV